MKFWQSLVFLVVSLFSVQGIVPLGNSIAFGFGGKMIPLVYKNDSLNWKVANPKVVFAFGLIQKNLVQHYTRVINGNIQKQIHSINPNIAVAMIPNATGQEVVDSLMDPNTIGFVFISHSYKTENTHSTIMIGADGHELPSSILSAASPALRFVSFLGCHGPTIRQQYEIDYQLKKPNGLKIFYEPFDKYLSTSFLIVDNVKRILKKEIQDLKNRLTSDDLVKGLEPDFSQDGTLTLRVKDVYAQIEPRYIRVNDQIIGVLGSNAEHSNQDRSYQDFSYRVPASAFLNFDLTEEGGVQSSVPDCHDVRFLSANLTPGVLLDNYLIESVSLTGPFGKRERTYQPAWHIGEQTLPPKSPEPQPPVLKGSRATKQKQAQAYLTEYVRFKEWLDLDPTPWENSLFKGRFYKDCF